MLRIEEQNDEVVLQVDSLSRRNLSMADAAVDAVAAVVVHMCRLSAGTGFTPQRLLFGHAAPPDSRPFEDYFRAPVTFAAAHHELELIFAADPLTAPLPTGNAALAMANEQIVIDYLARFDRSDMSLQVRAKLIEQLPDGIVDQSRIATALNTSLRNLQRQLQREGMSFRQLLDQTRHDLALGYLSDSALMLNEIAYLLGFSEPANFTRAFRRWTGRTPSEHREAG
jgi:AraC-like DNA-binding protein